MSLLPRLLELEGLLAEHRDLWHPQPFREPRPAWFAGWPALADELLALPDDAVEQLNDDGAAARRLLTRHLPEIGAFEALLILPQGIPAVNPVTNMHWAWGIPGRKRAQIEAFVAASQATGRPALEWCAGKGHLGRLFALKHGVAVSSLEINVVMCADGEMLARRAGIAQEFIVADALTSAVPQACHALALHACGELHRALLQQADQCTALDIAPCCYHQGVEVVYQPMSAKASLQLTRDDVRLAVTETVTASRQQALQRDRDMAWKLGFDCWRRQQGAETYASFKPVPPAWLRNDFAYFCRQMALRAGLELAAETDFANLEAQGWQRQREVMQLSIVRHAFRRPLELWLALDMAVFLEEKGWQVEINEFCTRNLTPRNLMISARK
ncbi:MAG: hypothetical protein H6R18_1954 [Proteobacteria bacterium]|nr:hypothetical protein [Pseudomonadota bacterium]